MLNVKVLFYGSSVSVSWNIFIDYTLPTIRLNGSVRLIYIWVFVYDW